MNEHDLRAEAARAEGEANAIFATITAARNKLPPDVYGARPLTPPGFAEDSARASELKRKARVHLQLAEKMAAEATPLPTPTPTPAPPPVAASRPETSKSTAPVARKIPSPASAADPVEREAREILDSDKGGPSRDTPPEIEREAQEILNSDAGEEETADEDALAREILEA